MGGRALFLGYAVLGSVLLTGCSASNQAQPKPMSALLTNITKGSDCTGHFAFASVHHGSGQSVCGTRHGVFTVSTEQPVTKGLACDYALNYTGPKDGTGHLT